MSIALFGLIILFNFSNLKAQQEVSACNALLRHGIYNISTKHSDESIRAYLYQKYKNTEWDKLEESAGGQLETEVLGYFDLDAAGNWEKRKERYRQLIESFASARTEDRSSYTQIQTLSESALEAWNNCQQFTKDSNIKMTYKGEPLDRPEVITIAISSPGGGSYYLQNLKVTNFDCECTGIERRLSLSKKFYTNVIDEFPHKITNEGITIHCERTGLQTKQHTDGTTYREQPSSSIAINVSANPFLFYYDDYHDGSLPDTDVERFENEISRIVNEDIYSAVPIGTILPFAGGKDQVPYDAGWLLCDGSSVAINDYPELHAAIKKGWGSGNSSGEFRLPDLRGQFLRGVESSIDGKSSGTDPGDRHTKYEGGNTGIEVGTYQDEDYKSHPHYYREWRWQVGVHGGGSYNDILTANRGNNPLVETENNPGGKETRPDNAAVYYIIRGKSSKPRLASQ